MIRAAWRQALAVTVGNVASVQRRTRARRAHRLHLADTLASFQVRFPDPAPPDDDPVFLFSAGWRSGSTLLQRICMASGDRLVWGEPYDHSAIVQTLADQLRPFATGWPDDDALAVPEREALVQDFVATLYPEAQALRAAHRAYFDRLFAQPARERGFAHWGLKEVRLGVEHAAYLRWLYPRARFVFLVRDPQDAWRSYRPWRRWFWRWPDVHIATPAAFGRCWSTLASDFLDEGHRVDGLLLRYEDRADWSGLAAHLGHDAPAASELPRVGGAFAPDARVPKAERAILAQVVRGPAARLGYR